MTSKQTMRYMTKEDLGSQERVLSALRLLRAGISLCYHEVASLLGCSYHTVYRAVGRGELVAAKLTHRTVRVRAEEVRKLLLGDFDLEPLDDCSLAELANRICHGHAVGRVLPAALLAAGFGLLAG